MIRLLANEECKGGQVHNPFYGGNSVESFALLHFHISALLHFCTVPVQHFQIFRDQRIEHGLSVGIMYVA